MHLLAAQPGAVDDGEEAVDLGQTPADIVFITAADTEIACFAAAQSRRVAEDPNAPSMRVANLLHLGHNYSVDLYVDTIVSKAKFVVCRLLGGRSYWTYGTDEVAAACKYHGIPVVFLPGDDKPDPELSALSTSEVEYNKFWDYFIQGGIDNAQSVLSCIAVAIGYRAQIPDPAPILKAGLYWPDLSSPSLADLPQYEDNTIPRVAILFYRALVQAGNLGAIDGLIESLRKSGTIPVPIFATSLKDEVSAAAIQQLCAEAKPDVILNGMGFAVSQPGAPKAHTPLDDADCPILQVVFSGSNKEAWSDSTKGLSARDIAMHVALPEVDGRILSRAVSFKGSVQRDPLVQADIVGYDPVEDRCDFVSTLAARWAGLRRKPPEHRRIGIVLANYPNRDGRLGNGVGLDTPAGTVRVLHALAAQGYTVDIPFSDGDALIAHLADGPTNAAVDGRVVREVLSHGDYLSFWNELDEAVRCAVQDRWGDPEEDPFFRMDNKDFAIPVFCLGNIAIGLQPARGYNIDAVETYHDPALPPPHGYLAFYAWMRRSFAVDAIVHMGKHGNMEWLPGKATALSASCFPEAVFGPLPHFYPFIVNDPGEGTQAKRRSQAVILDHLTPPLTRAETYGPLRDLELLVDEYYEAAQGDPRRIKVLRKEILELTQSSGLDKDIGLTPDLDEENALAVLDNHLCELKEMQIRDGLHIFGISPDEDLLDNLLVALVRSPRGSGSGSQASILRALAEDLSLSEGFDPLDCTFSDPWTGSRPDVLQAQSTENWRTKGDTVERLEQLALGLIAGSEEAAGPASGAVTDWVHTTLRPMVASCGDAELAGLCAGLDGRFVQPGPSGAPTRGRPEVLPTGRNFYSVDTRMVPTPAAWTLGWKSAQLLVERYAQDHGDYPKQMAISAWGTSNMRTGGDDVAQAMALLGVRPRWDDTSRRVTGFEVLPADLLDRPRVDVTFRISGFFRDAFPGLIDLLDSAVRAVAALDEPASVNPLAARVQAETLALMETEGLDADQAGIRAGSRVFGSKPGAYGAGLQALIDEKIWTDDKDLADAYLTWGGYAYGHGQEGVSDRQGFEKRLHAVQAVVQNQDNREHDLLDSDDYYQFEGGMTAAVRTLSGEQPAVYHNDHSRPESPRIRTLKEEIARVVRARVVNPKWIEGVMRHGYKGAFEMAATVDYLFAFSATARVVEDHHFDLVFDAYLGDEAVRSFLETHNAAALRDMADRLLEAQDRGLWSPKRNSTREILQELRA